MAIGTWRGVAAEDTNNIIAKLLNEVNSRERWNLENVTKLENNLQVLNIDFRGVKGLLIQISNLFQSRQRRLPKQVETSLQRIEDILNLIDDTNR